MADALGAVGKPMIRVHTAGSVGGSTALVAASLVQAGDPRPRPHRRLREAIGVRRDVGARDEDPVLAAARRRCRRLLRATHPRVHPSSSAPDDIGIKVAVKDRLNGVKNPYAHLHQPDITYEEVRDSLMLWAPIRYLETCPSSDGACALVLASESAAKAPTPSGVGARHARCAPSRRCSRDATR